MKSAEVDDFFFAEFARSRNRAVPAGLGSLIRIVPSTDVLG